ncbi:MAG TPA: response regulator [Terriglobales bacterium]|nr:response regulator [Terriglobales bacterium]
MELRTSLGHILVVDDDELVRDYLHLRLQEAGYSCTAVANGLEAIDNLRRHATPDVILLDLNMPGLDGIEFLRLAQEHIGHAFGVIVMTGVAGPRLREQVMRFGAFTMIEKPVDFDKLVRLLRIQRDFLRTKAALRAEGA